MIEIKNLHKSFDGKEVLKGITSTFDSVRPILSLVKAVRAKQC